MKLKKLLFLTLSLLIGCYPKSHPITLVTPPVVESSTYLIHNGEIQGTAWVVAEGFVATAGHICEDYNGSNFTLKSSTGRQVIAHPFNWEMSDDSHADVCLLKVDGHIGRPLTLASSPPPIGALDFYIGYPKGEFHKGAGFVTKNGSSAPCDHGASGSAVATEMGVYGVLVQERALGVEEDGSPHYTGEFGCEVTPIQEVIDLLQENGIRN